MTAIQMNAELFRQLSIIAEDEGLMAKLLKYAKKLTASKQADPTLMTKEEFFQRVDKARAQYDRGEYTTQLPGESVSDMLKRCGYEL